MARADQPPPLSEDDDARIRAEVAAMPPRDEGWRSDGDDTMRELAVELRGLGVPVDRALSILARAYKAVASEYGD